MDQFIEASFGLHRYMPDVKMTRAAAVRVHLFRYGDKEQARTGKRIRKQRTKLWTEHFDLCIDSGRLGIKVLTD